MYIHTHTHGLVPLQRPYSVESSATICITYIVIITTIITTIITLFHYYTITTTTSCSIISAIIIITISVNLRLHTDRYHIQVVVASVVFKPGACLNRVCSLLLASWQLILAKLYYDHFNCDRLRVAPKRTCCYYCYDYYIIIIVLLYYCIIVHIYIYIYI